MSKLKKKDTFILKSCNPKKFVKYKLQNRKLTDPLYIEGLDRGDGTINKFIEYNEFENKITKISKTHKKCEEKLEGYYSSLKPHTFYKCGDRKRITKKILSKMKVPKDKSYKSYFTQINNKKPFLVYTKKKEVFIYKRDTHLNYFLEECNTKKSKLSFKKNIRPKNGYNKLIKKYKNIKNIFIGKSPKNDVTIYSKSYGKEFDGNTILIQLKNNECIFIGNKIFKFKALSEIVKYISPVGLANVPYPYALDKNNNTYLLIENIIMTDIPKGKYNPYYYLDYEEFGDKYKPRKFNIKLIEDKEIDNNFRPDFC